MTHEVILLSNPSHLFLVNLKYNYDIAMTIMVNTFCSWPMASLLLPHIFQICKMLLYSMD